MRSITALLVAALAFPVWAQVSYDPVASDPISSDSQFPAAIALPVFPSGGSMLNGRGLIAQGAGPHPTVLLLHGFPGNELNMDLAQAMRRAGWNVFMFHYRGNWGSGGQYSFDNVLADTAAVLGYLRTKSDPAWRVDPARIVLVGHSVGAFAALNTAAADARLKSVASIAGFDVARAGELMAANEKMRTGFTGFLRHAGSVNVGDPDAFMKAWTSSPSSWKFPDLGPKLASKNVLLVAGTRDTTAPMAAHFAPLADALAANPEAKARTVVLDSDHSFSDRRIALTRAVLDWLSRQ